MAERKVEIGIRTTADTKGADAAVDALDEVVDKGREVEAAIDQVDGRGLEEVTDKAKPAKGSIDALENEVSQLVAELHRLPVGSEEFTKMATRVQGAQKSLAAAQTEARKLGATMGRQGNAGAAVLEFSRAFEDAQYGIRGVLNNLPGLIAMLGGSAGLAGVISLVAVVGSQLWEAYSAGSKKATEDTVDFLAIAKKLQEEFGNEALEIENLRGDSMDTLLAKQQDYAAAQQRIATAESDLEKKRIQGDGGVAVAAERLNLTRIETELLTASGERAVKLAKDREAALKRIVALEERTAELLRLAEERAAKAKVTAAQEALGRANQTKDFTAENASEKGQSLGRAAEVLASATEQRLKSIQGLITEREAAIARQAKTNNPLESVAAETLAKRLSAAIEAAQKNPTNEEATALVNRDAAEAAAKAAAENFKKASDDQRAAAQSLKDATLGLDNLRASQNQERTNEGQIKAISDAGATDTKIRDAGAKASADIGTVLTDALRNIGEAANSPEVKTAAERIKELAADGVQAGEQNEIFQLFQQLLSRSEASAGENVKLLNQFIGVVDASISTITTLSAKVDEQNRIINGIQNTIKGLTSTAR